MWGQIDVTLTGWLAVSWENDTHLVEIVDDSALTWRKKPDPAFPEGYELVIQESFTDDNFRLVFDAFRRMVAGLTPAETSQQNPSEGPSDVGNEPAAS